MKTIPGFLLALSCSMLVLQTGCISTSPKLKSESLPPPPSNSIVLVRLSVTIDETPTDPFKGNVVVFFNIANLESEQPRKLIRPVPVAEANFRKDGWAYLLLEPGAYRVTIQQPFVEHPPIPPAPYRLYVPANHPLLYAGSFQAMDGRGRWSIGGHIPVAREIRLEFESDAAQTVAQAEFGAAGHLTLAEVQLADVLAAPLCELGEISVVTTASETLEPPHWLNRAAGDYVNAALVPVPSGSGEVGAALMAYDLAAMPFAALAGAIEGHASKKKWTPCVQELSKELAACHLAGELQGVLLGRLHANGVTQACILGPAQLNPAPGDIGCPWVLHGDISKVSLVQGPKRELVCTEIILRFRLLDALAEHCLYDRQFLLQSEMNDMKEYSGDTGRALFHTHLTDAVQLGVQQFLWDAIPSSPARNDAELTQQ